jgi:hypothetical protein
MSRGLLVLRWGGVALTLVAIVAQVKTVSDAGALNAVNFFSYFTIQSNLIGAFTLGASAIHARRRSAWLDWLRGAAALYLTVTFLVVIALLKEVDVGLQLPWVDFALHEAMPVIVVADFLLDPPRSRYTMRDAVLWLGFPLVWLAYTLIRGPIADWYPYPFLDPANGGYGAVAVTSAAIFVGGLVLAMLYRWLGNLRAGRSQPLVG